MPVDCDLQTSAMIRGDRKMLKSAMRHSVRGISALLFACALVACGSSSPVSSSAQNATPRVEPVTRYDMANACYAQIGRAHVRTPVTNAHLVCRLLLEKKNK